MSLRKLGDFDSEREVAGPQDVDDAVVFEPGVEPELLDESGVAPGGRLGLVLAVGPGAGDLTRWPDGGCCVGLAKLHGNHLKDKIALNEKLKRQNARPGADQNFYEQKINVELYELKNNPMIHIFGIFYTEITGKIQTREYK